jgi:glucose-1-phosphate adenylyltransferase
LEGCQKWETATGFVTGECEMNDGDGKTPDQNPPTESLALVLAGGSGTRLAGLTACGPKAAVPFGAHFRAIDFTLSNCINSGIRQIALLTQYKSQSLIRHVQGGWGFLHPELGEFIDIWPAQQLQGERWYAGTADAVHQNLDLIKAANPEQVLVLPGDHVYSMDYSALLDEHAANRADLTLGCIEVPLTDSGAHDTVVADEDGRVRSFLRASVGSLPARGQRTVALTSMGIYVFNASFLFERLVEDAANTASAHDFGHDVLPSAIAGARVYAHVFRGLSDSAPPYWRDVGTIDSYWQAHMDLLEDPPKLDLFDRSWPIWTHQVPAGPTHVQGSVRLNAAILGRGCTIAGEISRSVISTNCRVDKHSRITNSILLPNVRVGSGCALDHVIIDSGCVIPDNTVIGSNSLADSEHHVSAQGIVLIEKYAAAAYTALPSVPRKVA